MTSSLRGAIHSGLKIYIAISGFKLNLSLNNLYFLKVLSNPNGVSLLDRKPVTAGFISLVGIWVID